MTNCNGDLKRSPDSGNHNKCPTLAQQHLAELALAQVRPPFTAGQPDHLVAAAAAAYYALSPASVATALVKGANGQSEEDQTQQQVAAPPLRHAAGSIKRDPILNGTSAACAAPQHNRNKLGCDKDGKEDSDEDEDEPSARKRLRRASHGEQTTAYANHSTTTHDICDSELSNLGAASQPLENNGIELDSTTKGRSNGVESGADANIEYNQEDRAGVVAFAANADGTKGQQEQLKEQQASSMANKTRAPRSHQLGRPLPLGQKGQHSVASFPSATGNSRRQQQSANLCREFLRNNCKRAECRFVHQLASDSVTMQQQQPNTSLPRRSAWQLLPETVCRDFMRGHCSRTNANCRYSHPASHIQHQLRRTCAAARFQAPATIGGQRAWLGADHTKSQATND